MKPSISGELRRSYQSNSTTGPPYKILVANATLEETLSKSQFLITLAAS
jgi:hypothetical protein